MVVAALLLQWRLSLANGTVPIPTLCLSTHFILWNVLYNLSCLTWHRICKINVLYSHLWVLLYVLK